MRFELPLDRRTLLMALGASALAAPLRAASAPVVAKLVIEDGRVWIAARIGTSEPLLFWLDTGAAGNFIRPDLAKQLKLPTVGRGIVGGVGGQSAATMRVEARDVVVGGAFRQPRMQFQTYGVGGGETDDSAGLLAAGLITAYDTDLDFVRGEWRVWLGGREGDPRGAPLAGSSIKGAGASERIFASASIDGQTYKLALDTGSPASILLFPKASARSGLFNARAYAPTQISGFGGAARKPARLLRGTMFEFGPLAIKRPFLRLMDPGEFSGGFGMGIDGLIGLPLISLLDLSTEVRRDRVWAARNSRPAQAPSYPLAGIWFDRRAEVISVELVGTGSPAEAADVKPGDIVDGVKSIPAARALVEGPAGKAVELSLIRSGTKITRKFVLAPYL